MRVRADQGQHEDRHEDRHEEQDPFRQHPRPLLSTRALVILLAAGGAAVIAAIEPDAAVPIGIGVGVVTLLAQIVRD